MRQANIHEAKTHLSRLVEDVTQGEDIVIARAGKPVVRLVKFTSEAPLRGRGLLKEKLWMADDFDEPLPDDVLGLFEGEA